MERYTNRLCILFFAIYGVASLHAASFKLGVENIPDALLMWLRTCRVGLVMNHTSVNHANQRTVDILLHQKVPVTLLFAPEHGLDGKLHAYTQVHDSHDTQANIPVASIYTCGRTHQMIDHRFKNLDVLIFDIQDCGMRHFTYVSTLLHMMDCAARYQMPFVVFDRPNPLGGCAEGPVGNLLPLPHGSLPEVTIPLRYGLTIGELARYFNQYAFKNSIDLRIIPMRGYQRNSDSVPVASYTFSPNIQSKPACHGYSFLGLLGEVRPFDIALSTPTSFQCLLLPADIHCAPGVWSSLQSQLKKLGIESSAYSYDSARKKKRCKGLKFSIPAITKTSAFQAFLASVILFTKAGVPIVFSKGFDTAVGSNSVRLFLQGTLDQKSFINTINHDVHDFFNKAQSSLLYTPAPRIIELVL